MGEDGDKNVKDQMASAAAEAQTGDGVQRASVDEGIGNLLQKAVDAKKEMEDDFVAAKKVWERHQKGELVGDDELETAIEALDRYIRVNKTWSIDIVVEGYNDSGFARYLDATKMSTPIQVYPSAPADEGESGPDCG